MYEKRLKDDQEIFDDTELTLKELKKRKLEEKILELAKKNVQEGDKKQ